MSKDLDDIETKTSVKQGQFGLNRSKSQGAVSSSSQLRPHEIQRGLTKQPKPPNYPIKNKMFYRFSDENYTVGVVTMQGKRETMEDDHTVKLSLAKEGHSFFGIFDGHSGAEAAHWCAQTLHKYIENLDVLNQETIAAAMIKADKDFLESGINVMNGTTAVFAITQIQEDGWKIVVANLGDSRCIIGNYSNDLARCMTTDHKPMDEGESKRVVEAGGFVAQKRVDGLLAVSRSIGDGTYKNIEGLAPEKQKVIPIPDVTETLLTEDNYIFICCDGIFETFNNEEAIKFIYEKSKTETDICLILSDLLTAVLNRGSKDNMSAMIIRKKRGVEYNHSPQFVPGEFYPNGTDVYLEAYKNNCLSYGYSLDEAMRLFAEQKAQAEAKRLEGLTLDYLRQKYVKSDCMASNALKTVFFGESWGVKKSKKDKV